MIFVEFFFWQNLDNKWHQTVLEFNSNRTEALPVIDISPYDISTSDMKQEFFVEIGPVCFFYWSISSSVKQKILSLR